ncbi:MAG: tRNA-dihydrouridine synthase family protein [Puniceicoccales bacterium]|jgi:tRNA-dihydrouridine synthase|nr:tRNA-dihydrouridine synthase family protein [Puniceicoccales bacterium]
MDGKATAGRKFSTAIAPMHGLATRQFLDILSDFCEPDECISGFLRVHETSVIAKDIVDLIENRRGMAPLSIQLLGKDPKHFVRVVGLLRNCGISAINVNLGCPMAKIRKKGVGGALLAELDTVDGIISALAEETNLPISVKIRVGYADPLEFDAILEHLAQHGIAALYLHGRTVMGLYSEPVDFACISKAKAVLRCPVIANGDIKSAEEAMAVVEKTYADGVMIGRAAVTNPWIFRQINEIASGLEPFAPSGEDYANYIEKLKASTHRPGVSEIRSISAIKKYLVPIADSLDHGGDFSIKIRRAETFHAIGDACEEFFIGEWANRGDCDAPKWQS